MLSLRYAFYNTSNISIYAGVRILIISHSRFHTLIIVRKNAELNFTILKFLSQKNLRVSLGKNRCILSCIINFFFKSCVTTTISPPLQLNFFRHFDRYEIVNQFENECPWVIEKRHQQGGPPIHLHQPQNSDSSIILLCSLLDFGVNPITHPYNL